jgi:hypothetical protein
MFDTSMEYPTLEQRLAFLGLLPAPDARGPHATSRLLAANTSANVRASVAGSSIVAVAGAVSRDDEQAVLDCALYLEQYTDTRYNRETQWYEWLQHYTLGLWHLGWIHQRPVMLESQLTVLYEPITSAILDTLKPNVSVPVYDAAMQAFNSLKGNLQASILFSQKSGREHGRHFQTMPCAYDANGQLTLMLLHAWYEAEVSPEQFLFIKWLEHEVTLVQHYGAFTLDKKRFNQVAAAMRVKITERSRGYLMRM